MSGETARGRRACAVALALAGLLALPGCLPESGLASPEGAAQQGDNRAPDGYRFHGRVPDRPTPRPSFLLTDTSGAPYDFAARTAGRVTYLYYGFTHCPDECPTTLADLAAALRRMPAATRAVVDVVLVTTDPARDTGPVLRRFLDGFDASFIGLTGTAAEVEAAQRAGGVPVAVRRDPTPSAGPGSAAPPTPGADGHAHRHGATGPGDYDVDHSAALIVYGRNDRLSVMYPVGSVPDDYAADLPALVGGEGARP